MKLTIETDTEKPLGSIVYIDGKKVGALQAIGLRLDMNLDIFHLEMKATKLAPKKVAAAQHHKSAKDSAGKLISINIEVMGKLMSPLGHKLQVEDALAKLEGNLRKVK